MKRRLLEKWQRRLSESEQRIISWNWNKDGNAAANGYLKSPRQSTRPLGPWWYSIMVVITADCVDCMWQPIKSMWLIWVKILVELGSQEARADLETNCSLALNSRLSTKHPGCPCLHRKIFKPKKITMHHVARLGHYWTKKWKLAMVCICNPGSD